MVSASIHEAYSRTPSQFRAKRKYIIVTDVDGTKTEVRAGPSARGGSGTVVASVERYQRYSTEWGPDEQPYPYIAAREVVPENGEPAAPLIDALTGYANLINEVKIPYRRLSTNSNAFAREALDVVGIPAPRTPVWAPGYDTSLPRLDPPNSPPNVGIRV
jgi:hypothetical protein